MKEAAKAARIYLRVSTEQQDLERQRDLVEQTKQQGYYVAGVYEDKGSGTQHNRPGLQRLIADLQPGDVVIAEKIDRITRAPLDEAEALIEAIEAKGARLAIPGLMDLSDIEAEGMAKIVLDGMQSMLLKIALYMARDDYETRRQRQVQGIARAKQKGVYQGRKPDTEKRQRVAACLKKGMGIRETARVVGVSPTTVQRIRNEQELAAAPRSG